jgi:hypothetical protein
MQKLNVKNIDVYELWLLGLMMTNRFFLLKFYLYLQHLLHFCLVVMQKEKNIFLLILLSLVPGLFISVFYLILLAA